MDFREGLIFVKPVARTLSSYTVLRATVFQAE